MLRKEKDAITKAKGNQFRGVNNSEKRHTLGQINRKHQIAGQANHNKVTKNNTKVFMYEMYKNITRILNLKVL